jgi:hypothetical protein
MLFISHLFLPQKDDPESEMYWLQFSDYYEWPHIQYFDDYNELKQKLLKSDFKLIHEKMKEETEIKGLRLNSRWCDVIEKIRRSKNSR